MDFLFQININDFRLLKNEIGFEITGGAFLLPNMVHSYLPKLVYFDLPITKVQVELIFW